MSYYIKYDWFFPGDLNIKIDNINDYNTQNFNIFLHNFNLSQHVSFSTHDSKHILDLIITNDLSKLNIHLCYVDACISNNKTICVDSNFLKQHIRQKTFLS